ncbi:hypothetical protein F2P81_025632 [Scophthalmus maximus]|uniref:Uncharacterized protein n=1 Tax=Scophthalmus maximus TaxID=52904 RepID=A0A6A4RPE5_SCOMX|nr:hypothetical protein F2P81_025632 [Scophthalmus maximus]
MEAKRSQSISNCVHLYEALPTTKSVPMLLHTVSSFLPGISSGNSACSHRLSDVEECQLSECGGEEELGGRDSPLPRSSSTSDITQQPAETLPGESISSETSNGYLNEAEVTWQAFDEEADTQSTQSAHMDVTTDPQGQGSLLLSHNEALAGPECAHPPHSAPPSYHHHNHYHYPQNPPTSPALLVHTECPRDYPLDDNMHQSVLHMPHHLGTAP